MSNNMEDIFYLSDDNISATDIYRVACEFYGSGPDFSLLMAGDGGAFQIRRATAVFLDVTELEGELVLAEANECNRGFPIFCFSFHGHELDELSKFFIFIMEKIGGRFGMDDDNFEPTFDKDEIQKLLAYLGVD